MSSPLRHLVAIRNADIAVSCMVDACIVFVPPDRCADCASVWSRPSVAITVPFVC